MSGSGTRIGRHVALWHQPWQARRADRGWRSPWVGPVVLTLGCAGLALAWPARAALFLALAALVSLAWHGWLVVDGLMRQNEPVLARLLPGHVATLRVQLLLHLAVLALSAWAVLVLAFGPGRPWLWLVLPVVVLLAWLPREPVLWLPVALATPPLPLWAWAAEAQQAAPGLKLLALLACAALVVASVGRGGAWHRAQAARGERRRRAAAAQREGHAAPSATLGLLDRAALRLFDWPRLLWRRRVLARGAAAPLAARLDLGLGIGGQGAELAWGVVIFGGISTTLVFNRAWQDERDLAGLAAVAVFGVSIGAYSMIAGTLYGRLGPLWARRREQALLALLPGVPAHDLRQQERRWRRGYAAAWAVATAGVLAVGATGGPASLDYAAACAALFLPLPWLAQHLQRRLQGPPSVAVLAVAPVLAGLVWPLQQLVGVPAAASLALGAAAWGLLARRHDARPLALPVGRSG
ncbi:MAG: hypothetical protein ACK57B_18220 [Betaproteobacteria bacterium]